MKAARQFGIVILLLGSYLTPAMACMIPGAPMTIEERACCRMMQNKCEQMEMPASHGCCHKTPPNVLDNALNVKAVGLHPVSVTVVWLASPELLNPTSGSGRAEHHVYSPPQSPPPGNSILRI